MTASEFDEQRLVIRLRNALIPFLELNPRMPARAIETFWVVVSKPGLSVDDYAKRIGCPPTTISRFLLDLGERDRKGEPGAGLVEAKKNVLDLRETLYHLTPKGHALKALILGRFQ